MLVLISFDVLFVLQNNSINAELGLAASDDALLDTLAERAEREIVSGGSGEKNLIGHGIILAKTWQ